MKKSTTLAAAITVVGVAFAYSTAAIADASSPWTQTQGSAELSVRYGQQTADRFFAGGTEMDLPTDLEQSNTTIDFSYGINDQLSFDARVGYSSSDFLTDPGLAPKGGLSGIQDTRLGVRYRWTDPEGPTAFTTGLTAIISGNYDTGALPAVGDGESGFEATLLVGHSFDSGLLLQAGIARREFGGEVPSETVFNAGLGFGFTDTVSAGLFYQNVRSNGNLDIGGPGFSPARFPEVDEDYALFGAGLSATITEGWALSLDFGRKFDGRNTAKSRFFQIGASYFF
jgi:hypothetical protein